MPPPLPLRSTSASSSTRLKCATGCCPSCGALLYGTRRGGPSVVKTSRHTGASRRPVYAAMSEVAATNPHAWHPLAKTVDEILEVNPANRMPVRPYRKLMMASPKVNQAAALLIASHATADDLGVPDDRRVYIRGWSSAGDYPYVAENEDL